MSQRILFENAHEQCYYVNAGTLTTFQFHNVLCIAINRHHQHHHNHHHHLDIRSHDIIRSHDVAVATEMRAWAPCVRYC